MRRAFLTFTILAVLVLFATQPEPTIRADVVTGEYSLGLSASETGGFITLETSLEQDGSSPGPFGAAQWHIEYDESVVRHAATSVNAAAGCPYDASSANGTRLLLGCADLQAETVSYSGTYFSSDFICIAAGTASFDITQVGSTTFVSKASTNQLVHAHSTTATCNVSHADGDEDGIADSEDNCPTLANPEQEDADSDNIGDACDEDTDSDGLPDAYEDVNGCLDLGLDDAAADPDLDGDSNLLEYANGTNPCEGEWRMRLDASESAGVVTLDLFIEAHGVAPGPYQAAQWRVNYDGNKVQTTVADIANIGPPQCVAHSLTTSYALAGCLDLSGPNMTFNGAAWRITWDCVAIGTADFTLALFANPGSFVFNSIDSIIPLAVDASAVCTAVADFDGDGIAEGDNCPATFNPAQEDLDEDDDGDVCDEDDDGDGMPDAYELAHSCLDERAGDAAGDGDNDGFTNLAEYLASTPPCPPDTDGDGLPDTFELTHSCLDPGIDDSGNDPDGDGSTSLSEYAGGTDPCAGRWRLSLDASEDAGLITLNLAIVAVGTLPPPPYQAAQWRVDYDNMRAYTTLAEVVRIGPPSCISKTINNDPPNSYVLAGCLDLSGPVMTFSGIAWRATFSCLQTGTLHFTLSSSTPGSFVDDGLEQLDVDLAHDDTTCTVAFDIDDDGLTGADDNCPFISNVDQENLDDDGQGDVCDSDDDGDGMPDAFEDSKYCLDSRVDDASEDGDNDGDTNLDEFMASTEPCPPDADGDGMHDSFELAHPCLNPGVADATLDPDGDGVTNIAEYLAGANPCAGRWRLKLDAVAQSGGIVLELIIEPVGTMPPPSYQGAQWHVEYDNDRVATTLPDVINVGPPQCTSKTLVGSPPAQSLLAGCLDLGGPLMTYAGTAWQATFECLQEGAASFTLQTSASPNSFVNDGMSDLEILTANDSGICAEDSDGDGCSNSKEVGPNAVLGGQRDPDEYWDFYDVNVDRVIDLRDTLVILQHFGHNYNEGSYVDPIDNDLDRFVPDINFGWRTAEANNGIDLTDALANLRSFGHGCAA